MSPHLPVTIPADRTRRFRVLSLGLGVQSVTAHLLAARGEIECVVASVFADPGEESTATYKTLEWLKTQNGPPIHVVRASDTSLGDNLILGRNSTGQSYCSIPTFTALVEGKKLGLGRRQCTDEYKIRPIERWIRQGLLGMKPGQRVPKDVHVTQLIGISLDEVGRAHRVIANNEHAWMDPEFPLLIRGWSRSDCLTWLKANGYPVPERSACVFCPYKRDAEWLRLKTSDPKGWDRAVQIDRAIRENTSRATVGMTQRQYLHESCIPLEKIDFAARIAARTSDHIQLGFWNECKGMCGN